MIDSYVKGYVASRLEPRFASRLQNKLHLRLEDSAFNDIRKCARNSLAPYLAASTWPGAKLKSNILDSLAYKAEGVFLWLHIRQACAGRMPGMPVLSWTRWALISAPLLARPEFKDQAFGPLGRHMWPRFPKGVARRILRDVLLGLRTLHQHGIVHGDLHPGNILTTIPPLGKPLSHDPAVLQKVQQLPSEGYALIRRNGKLTSGRRRTSWKPHR